MYFIAVKRDLGGVTEIIGCHRAKEENKKAVDSIKDTRYEHISNGITCYEVLSFRTGLDLMANFIVDSNEKDYAKSAVLSLIDN